MDAQPDAELEALWKDDAEQVISAFDAHTESMKNQPGYLRGRSSTVRGSGPIYPSTV